MSDYFYSKSTGLFIYRKPIMIGSRVKKAADRAGIKLDWDNEGRIIYINFDDSKKLLEELGSRMLNPIEYWKALDDAKEENDTEMVKELTSNKYAEWLDRVYFSDCTHINNPNVIGNYNYDGQRVKSECPPGTPGWFNPENNINIRTGEPIHVEINREKFATSWKYWWPYLGLSATDRVATAPIRGYVTSVGKPSFDLGIPVDAKEPKLMVRECRNESLVPIIDSRILKQAEKVTSENVVEFVNKHGDLFRSYDSLIYKLREMFFDLLGNLALHKDIKKTSQKIYNKETKLSYEDFDEYVSGSRKNLEEALKMKKDVVFVMGHKNPDTDTVISSIFEAWRNHIMNGNKIVYVPIIQSNRIPDEVTRLLGSLSNQLLLSNDSLYNEAKDSGLARWISVDQNREPEIQKYFITIIDHHVVSESAKNRDVPKTLEMMGSCSAIITRKYIGMGLELPEKLARILYGATLMDTENRVKHKMTERDTEIMDYLKNICGVKDDYLFYQDLMSYLLNTDDSELLFRRDYKDDWGFGFAVTKIKNGFSEDGEVIKKDLISCLKDYAVANNVEKNLPLTLLKVTDYMEDNETVNRERIYLVFNEAASEKFRKTINKTIESVILFEFPEDRIENSGDYIDFYGTGMQLSRKKTAPVIQPVVEVFNSYFYSQSIGRWVKRDFLKYTKDVKMVAENLSTDSYGRINFITYKEAKELSKKLGIEMLSLNEYWKVLRDAKKIKDNQMVESLRGSNFVELLDSVILEKSYIVDHPEIDEDISGEKRHLSIPKGNPGLIHPDDVDIETGVPRKVMSPNIYGNKELWRYWEPDSDLVIPCRSYIFLLNQPCWDGKFHINDSFPNLGMRPVVKIVKEPNVNLSWNDSFLAVVIFSDGEKKIYNWPKNIIDFIDVE